MNSHLRMMQDNGVTTLLWYLKRSLTHSNHLNEIYQFLLVAQRVRERFSKNLFFFNSKNFWILSHKIISNCQQLRSHYTDIKSWVLFLWKQTSFALWLIHLDFICSSSQQIIKMLSTKCDLWWLIHTKLPPPKNARFNWRIKKFIWMKTNWDRKKTRLIWI